MPRGSAGRRVRFWPSFLRVVGLLGARRTICYLIATGDGRGLRIGFSAFRGRAFEVVLKECLEFSTSRRVHCKPSSSTDRSTDQANITQPRMSAKKNSGMDGQEEPKKRPRTTIRLAASRTPAIPVPVSSSSQHTHTLRATHEQTQIQISRLRLVLILGSRNWNW